jgi:hypothetical protein
VSAFWESLWLALRSVLRSGLRTTLTVLGVLIGIAAVVTVVALGGGRGTVSAPDTACRYRMRRRSAEKCPGSAPSPYTPAPTRKW